MSTILDALRRAESERASPPGTRLPPMGVAPANAAPARRGRPLALALAALLLLALAALAAWYAVSRRPAAPSEPARVALPLPATSTAVSPASASSPTEPLPAPAALLQVPGARVLPAAEPVPAPALPAAVASAPLPLPRLHELPDSLRQQLPPLQLGGSLHSPDARMRSLILNGQFFREGDQVAPGLVLEEIGPRAARLRFRGQAFELGY